MRKTKSIKLLDEPDNSASSCFNLFIANIPTMIIPVINKTVRIHYD